MNPELYEAIRSVELEGEPSKRERVVFVIQQIGTHTIEWEIIPYQEFYITLKFLESSSMLPDALFSRSRC